MHTQSCAASSGEQRGSRRRPSWRRRVCGRTQPTAGPGSPAHCMDCAVEPSAQPASPARSPGTPTQRVAAAMTCLRRARRIGICFVGISFLELQPILFPLVWGERRGTVAERRGPPAADGRTVADRRTPRRYRRGRDARASRSVAKCGGKPPRLLAVQIVSGKLTCRGLYKFTSTVRAADAKGAGKNERGVRRPTRRF